MNIMSNIAISKKILLKISGLNCEHDRYDVTLVYDDE